MGQPRPLLRLFSVFSYKQYHFYNQCEKMSKCPCSIWRRDSSPHVPYVHEASPITTRHGLPPWSLMDPKFQGTVRFANAILRNDNN